MHCRINGSGPDSTHLQARHEIGSLQQGQCGDLVDNLCDLRVDRSSSGLGGLPSPVAGRAGCVCSRDAQGGWADGAGELSAATSCGLDREGHRGGRSQVAWRVDRKEHGVEGERENDSTASTAIANEKNGKSFGENLGVTWCILCKHIQSASLRDEMTLGEKP